MAEPAARSTLALQPATIFRSALAGAAATERSTRRTRADRVQAIAALTDDDLARLTAEFEAILRSNDDASGMAASLLAALRTLSPDASLGEEVGDA